MNNELKVFENADFGTIRTTTEENGKVLFCGADVAKALGYANTKDALARHCKTDGVAFHDLIDSIGRTQQAKFISEGNVYRLISHSKLPSAERFESWIFDEVLPTIRKHGAYMTEQTIEKALTSPDFLIQLATKLKDEQEKRKELENKIEHDKPLVTFATQISNINGLVDMQQFAKPMKDENIKIGRNKMFEWFRENRYLISEGIHMNEPYQQYLNMGLFAVKEGFYKLPDGTKEPYLKTYITGKGQLYFTKKLKETFGKKGN